MGASAVSECAGAACWPTPPISITVATQWTAFPHIASLLRASWSLCSREGEVREKDKAAFQSFVNAVLAIGGGFFAKRAARMAFGKFFNRFLIAGAAFIAGSGDGR